ncbi:MAG: lipoyl(octanoyl) transferase [Pseudohongiellaceae bacterium]|jgi:lipoyl(octanoyl) transferase
MSEKFIASLNIRHFGQMDYDPVWRAMKQFTQQRDAQTVDEIWLLQHSPVFTQGQAGKAEHLLAPGDIPVVQSDRGGQVTYHGPGQLVAYLLIDIKRLGMGIRPLVTLIEQAIVTLLSQHNIAAHPRADAPGVYVASGAKIAQLGLRVSKGKTFHGLSLNIDMDMQPFKCINPCGYAGMAVTSMALETGSSLGAEGSLTFATIYEQLSSILANELGYNTVNNTAGDLSSLS